jgi:hypothetical protein
MSGNWMLANPAREFLRPRQKLDTGGALRPDRELPQHLQWLSANRCLARQYNQDQRSRKDVARPSVAWHINSALRTGPLYEVRLISAGYFGETSLTHLRVTVPMIFTSAQRFLVVVLLCAAAGLEALAQGGPGIFDRGSPRRCDSFDHCLQRCNAKGGTGGTDIGCATLCNARNCVNLPGTGAAPAGEGAAAGGAKGGPQNCRALPPGPEKKQCVERANPEMFEAKRGRCEELAAERGMAGKSPGKKDFMQSCMQGTAK